MTTLGRWETARLGDASPVASASVPVVVVVIVNHYSRSHDQNLHCCGSLVSAAAVQPGQAAILDQAAPGLGTGTAADPG